MRVRKLFRFSLRTFLVVSTLAGVWLAFHISGTQQQKVAVEGVLQFGGWVYYDYHFPGGKFDPVMVDPNASSEIPRPLLDAFGVDCFHNVVAVNLSYGVRDGKTVINARYTDEAMVYLEDLPHLRMLSLDYGQANEESMKHLAGAKRMEYLSIVEAKIGDDGASVLRNFQQLRSLTLHNTGITDRSMKLISELPMLTQLRATGSDFSNETLQLLSKRKELRHLDLSGESRIDDQGLPYLSGMSRLKELGLEGSQISDAGLKSFEQLSSLRKLQVGDTKITWRGADRWKKTLDHSIQFDGHALNRTND